MTPIIALASLLLRSNTETQTLNPIDDVWVYQFADDQTGDPFLRVWGNDGVAVGKSFEGHLNFSYSCLKFDLSSINSGAKLTSAKLVLVHAPEPGWSAEDSQKNPLEVRTLSNAWSEKAWAYEDAKKIHPSDGTDTILGTASEKPPTDDKTFVFEVDLMKNSELFQKVWAESMNSGTKGFAVALTSKLEPAQAGENTVYKFYSRSNEAELKPKLVITTE